MEPSPAPEVSWPQPDDAGRVVLKPKLVAMVRIEILLLLVAAPGALQVVQHSQQTLRMRGLIYLGVSAIYGLLLLYRMFTGGLDLTLDDHGFTLGQKRYGWADISGFNAGTWPKQKIVYFTMAGKRRPLPNLYGVPSPALADFLTRHGARNGSSISISSSAPQRRLSPAVWVAIIAIFVLLQTHQGMVADALWPLAAPRNSAVGTLDDYDLANEAGFNPALLPMLKARADAGDKTAMYQYADIYDPTDFRGETAVPKDAATAVYWYEQAVPLNDQGAERALGILYHEGIGVPHDDAEAASLFERAVTQHNDDIADYYLGVMLESGDGEARNLPRAVQLEQASAAQGNVRGQTELGRMYALGLGVPQNLTLAAAQWHLAAAQGSVAAKSLLTQYGLN